MIKNALICLKINSNDLFMLKVQEKYTYVYSPMKTIICYSNTLKKSSQKLKKKII